MSEADGFRKYTTVYCSPVARYHGDLIKAASDAASPEAGAACAAPSGWGGVRVACPPEALPQILKRGLVVRDMTQKNVFSF